MRIGSKKVDAPTAKAGKSVPYALPREGLLRAVTMVITANWTVTGGTGLGTIFSDAIFRLLSSLSLNVGGGPMQQWTGQTLGLVDKLLSVEPYAQDGPTLKAAGTSEAIRLQLDLPFYMPGVLAENAFALPAGARGANPNGSLALAAATALGYGFDGTVGLSDINVEFYARPHQGRDTAADVRQLGFVVSRQVEFDVAQSGKKRIVLDQIEKGMEIRGVLVEALSDAGNGFEYNDSAIKSVELEVDGRPEIEDTPFAVVQGYNKKDYQLSANETGVIVLDAAADRMAGRGQLWTVETDTAPVLVCDFAKQNTDRARVTVIAADRRHQG